MALRPGTRYPAQTDTGDADYPYGKARNASSFGDGTGTPLEHDWLNDDWGFKQALLVAAGITPSDDPDTATVSQYLAALQAVASASTSERHLRSLMQMSQINLNGTEPETDDYMAVASGGTGLTIIVKGGADGVFKIADETLVAALGITATSLGDCRAIAYNGSSRHVAVGNGSPGNAYSTNAGTSWSAGGSMASIGIPSWIVWDGTEFIAMAGGETRHSTNAVAWSAPSGDDFNDATGTSGRGMAVLVPGTVIAIGPLAVTAVTTDHGATWVAGTTIPTLIDTPSMCAIVGDGSGEVLAFIKGGFGSLVECWVTSDGTTWTKRSEHDGHDDGTTEFRGLMCQDTGLVVVASGGVPSRVTASVDRGRTWSPIAFYYAPAVDTIGVARGKIFACATERIFATVPLIA